MSMPRAVRNSTDAMQGDIGQSGLQSPRPRVVGAGELRHDQDVRQRGKHIAANPSVTQQVCRRGQGMARFAFVGVAVLLCACACTRTPEATGGADRTAVVAAEEPVPEPKRQNLGAKLPAGQPIVIENPYGSVFLRFGGYEHEVGIHSTLQQPPGAAVIEFKLGERDGNYLVAPRLPEGATLAEGQRLDLVVYVPEQHIVTVRTEQGDIESRGVKSDLDLKTVSGNIAVRGTEGTVQAETGEGSIETAFAEAARPGSTQRLATTTGNIVVGVTDHLDALVRMGTSGQFSTDYSIKVTQLPGAEPNKDARAIIGAPKAEIVLESRRGEIRLLRRAEYLPADEAPPTPPPR